MNFNLFVDDLLEDSITEETGDSKKLIVEVDADELILMKILRSNIDIISDLIPLYCKHNSCSTISEVTTKE